MISPPVWRARPFGSIRNAGRLFLFATAAIASAAFMGAFWGSFGAMLLSPDSGIVKSIWIAIAFVSVGYGVSESRKLRWWVPTRHWLVPRRLGTYGSPAFEVIFGLFLGPGFFTIIPFIGYHLLILLCIVTGNAWTGALVMALFGAARSLPVLAAPVVYAMRKKRYTHETAAEVNRWFDWFEQRMQLVRVMALSSVAGMSIAAIF